MKEEDLQKFRQFLLVYEFAVREINTKLEILNDEYNYIYDYNPIEHIKTRIKKIKSIEKKLEKLGIPFSLENATTHLNDIGGIRIICAFEDDVYYLFETLKAQNDIQVLQVKDYIKEPKPNGYRSFHAIITIPVFLSNGIKNVKIELQIRTILMDFWASLEHKLYYKKQIDVPQDVIIGLKDCASISQVLDTKMLEMKMDIRNLTK